MALTTYQNSILQTVAKQNRELLLEECDEEKLNAIKLPENKDCTVQAIAGCGKTYFVYGRTIFLMSNGSLTLPDILYLSFTNTACNETQQRLKLKLGQASFSFVNSFTIHSFCLGIMNMYVDICNKKTLNKTKPFAPFGEIESTEILNLMMESEKNIKNLQMIIDLIYLKDVCKKELSKKETETLLQFEKLCSLKECELGKKDTKCKGFKFLTYSEIIIGGIKCLMQSDFKLKKYKHIFVDEGQDTSFLQQEFVKELKKYCQCAVTIVGDEGQDIFPKPEKSRSFLRMLSDSSFFIFSNNKRCSPGIARAFKSILKYSIELEMQVKKDEKDVELLKERLKALKIEEKLDNEDDDIFAYSAKGWKEEKERILNIIRSSGDKTIRILCRVKSCLKDLSNYLTENAIEHDFLSSSSKMESKRIVLETIDSSKGKEADMGIICSFNQFILPFEFKSSSNKSNLTVEGLIAESRRFYLALGRFRKKVHLTYSLVINEVPAFAAVKKHLAKPGISMFYEKMQNYCRHIHYFQERDPFISKLNSLGTIRIRTFKLEEMSIEGKLKQLHQKCGSKLVDSLNKVICGSGKCEFCGFFCPNELIISCVYCKRKFCLEKGKEFSSCGFLNYSIDKKMLEPCCHYCQYIQKSKIPN